MVLAILRGLSVLSLLTAASLNLAYPKAGQTTTAVPVLVELFTAEGCSSCPPADTLFEKMIEMQPAKGATIVALGEHVDYWNQSGWKDRFASSVFTKRQQVYAAHVGKDDVYTPQMVVDGETAFVGTDVAAARQAIEHAMTSPHGSVVLTLNPTSVDNRRVAVSIEVNELPILHHDDPADIVLAVTEDRLHTEVKRGENQGRTLSHAAVVREMRVVADAANGGHIVHSNLVLAPEWRRENLKIVCFVQQRRSRHVIATAVVPIER